MAEKFPGYPPPETNYSRLPHAFYEHLPDLKLAELKLLLYILRHTWGFGDERKQMTADELCNGRWKLDRETGERIRMDRGTGLSSSSVKTAVRSLIEAGHVSETRDESDRGRVKRWFSVAICRRDQGGEKLPTESKNQGAKNKRVGGQNLAPEGPKFSPRTRERNLGKKPKKEGGQGPPSSRNDLGLVDRRGSRYSPARTAGISDFANQAAKKLRAVIVKYQAGADNHIPSREGIARAVDDLLRRSKLDRLRIQKAIKWGITNYTEARCGAIYKNADVAGKIIKWDRQLRMENQKAKEAEQNGRGKSVNGRGLSPDEVRKRDW